MWLRMERDEVPKGKIKVSQDEKLKVDFGETQQMSITCVPGGDAMAELLNSTVEPTAPTT